MAVLLSALLAFLILVPVLAARAAHRAGMLPSERKVLKLVVFPLSKTEQGRHQGDKIDAA